MPVSPCTAGIGYKFLVRAVNRNEECFTSSKDGIKYLEFRFQARLLADFVCGDSIKSFVPFYRNCLQIVCVYRMVPPLTKKIKTAGF